jgi:hypothetical protein
MSEEQVVSDEQALETLESIRAEKVSAEAVSDTVTALELSTELDAVRAEIQALRILIAEAFEFGANELRPLFGQGTLALVLDGCAEGLRKADQQ